MSSPSKHERLRWQKSAEREWDVRLVVVEEQEEAHQGCEVQLLQQQQNMQHSPTITFESLNVRLTRSNASIPWGFELHAKGADLIVSKLENGSMAEKAGICRGDTVQEILNQKAGNLNAALSKIQNASEITMTLRRPIKDSPSLSWAFQTSPNGQLAVEQYGPDGRVASRSDSQSKGFVNSFVSEANAPAVDEIERRRLVKNTTETRATNGQTQQTNGNLPYNTQTHKAESKSNWNQNDGNVIRHYESKRSYTRTESSSVPPDTNAASRLNGSVAGQKSQQQVQQVNQGYNAGNQQSQGFTAGSGQQKTIVTSSQGFTSGPGQQNQDFTSGLGQQNQGFTSGPGQQSQSFTTGSGQQNQGFASGPGQQTVYPGGQNYNSGSQQQKTTVTSNRSYSSGPGQQSQQNYNSGTQQISSSTQQISSSTQQSKVQQRSTSQGHDQPQQYPQFPQNQYNDQLKNIQKTQQQKSVVVPGGVDYTALGQQQRPRQNGHSTQQYSQVQKQQGPVDFSGSYESGQQVSGDQQAPKNQHYHINQGQGLGTQTYQLSQYDQTDTIGFPASDQQQNIQSQNQPIALGQFLQKQSANYQGQGLNAVQQGQFNQSYGQSPGHLTGSQQVQGQFAGGQQVQEQQNYGQFVGNQQIQGQQNYGQFTGGQQVQGQQIQGQFVGNQQVQGQQIQGQFAGSQQNQYSGVQGQQNYGGHQSRQGNFAVFSPRESQTLNRSQQRGYKELPRRSRSQPRCCSRSDVLPGPIIYYYPPNPRTYRELSPSARVRHLQYNSPLDLYSDEAAAEAYRQHTGQELRFQSSNPNQQQQRSIQPAAYLQSETSRLVHNEDLGMRPVEAGPQQSASLRRIANAVGVQLD